jgi:hypothetical protein
MFVLHNGMGTMPNFAVSILDDLFEKKRSRPCDVNPKGKTGRAGRKSFT